MCILVARPDRSNRKEDQMRRKTFDALLSAGGVLLTVVLIAAGALMLWGYSYSNGTVSSQLSAQKITFPPKAAFATAKPGTEITPAMIPYLEPYAGETMTNGAAGAGVRQPLHRHPPPGDRGRPDLLPALCESNVPPPGDRGLHRRRGQGADHLPGNDPAQHAPERLWLVGDGPARPHRRHHEPCPRRHHGRALAARPAPLPQVLVRRRDPQGPC